MNHTVDIPLNHTADAQTPVLSDAERAALIESLDAAHRRMETGDYVVLTPGKLVTMMEPHLAPAPRPR